MADFIRPQARATLWKWREVIVAIGIFTLGLWWLSAFYPPVRWVGWVFVVLGGILALAGLQRARFRQSGQGPGVVNIRERRLAYMGPLTGGVIDVDDLTRLELEPKALPAPHWILSGIGGQSLAIPINADGAEALFDVFATLPGIRTGQVLDVLSHTPQARVTIWSRSRPLLH